jgi:hypothetical protein
MMREFLDQPGGPNGAPFPLKHVFYTVHARLFDPQNPGGVTFDPGRPYNGTDPLDPRRLVIDLRQDSTTGQRFIFQIEQDFYGSLHEYMRTLSLQDLLKGPSPVGDGPEPQAFCQDVAHLYYEETARHDDKKKLVRLLRDLISEGRAGVSILESSLWSQTSDPQTKKPAPWEQNGTTQRWHHMGDDSYHVELLPYKNGLIHGTVQRVSAQYDVLEHTQYSFGKRQGTFNKWDERHKGPIVEGFYINDKPSGIWRFFDEDRQMNRFEAYHNGQLLRSGTTQAQLAAYESERRETVTFLRQTARRPATGPEPA